MAMSNLRVLDSAPGAARAHPLIDALIETLPVPGATFPGEEREAWLSMMATAFTLAYGAVGSPPRTEAAAVGGSTHHLLPRSEPDFYIGADNIARRRGGDRIVASEVKGELVDLRGMTGDLAAIRWADDTSGIPKDLSLNVTIG